jgi:hypothetical protein
MRLPLATTDPALTAPPSAGNALGWDAGWDAGWGAPWGGDWPAVGFGAAD